jgi:hypothetical protein
MRTLALCESARSGAWVLRLSSGQFDFRVGAMLFATRGMVPAKQATEGLLQGVL